MSDMEPNNSPESKAPDGSAIDGPSEPLDAAPAAPSWAPDAVADWSAAHASSFWAEPPAAPTQVPASQPYTWTAPSAYAPAGSANQPDPWASPYGYMSGAGGPGPGGPGSGFPAGGPNPQPGTSPYLYGYAAPGSTQGPYKPAPAQGGGWRRALPIILVAAIFSAALSAAGTYMAFTVVYHAPAAASSSQPASNAQLISLTQSDAIVRVASVVKPSVVTITTSGVSNLSPFSVPESGAGSGFIVSANGLILTNNHVVAGASTLTVTLDDTTQLAGKVVATDATHDLALVKVSATNLTPVTLGDSSTVQVGQLAIAIGSPLGTFTDSVTQGIVSGTDRSITVSDQGSRTTESLSGLIQTDAAINPGNSGGPLLDVAGNVIGIITASASSSEGIGFAIPINQAKQLIAQNAA